MSVPTLTPWTRCRVFFWARTTCDAVLLLNILAVLRPLLLGALSCPYLHPKIAIAVDEDVDIYNPWEIFWAISTRVNPERDIIVIPHERIHPLDISAPNVDKSEVTVMRVGGKMAIDATKPPLWRKKERAEFERVKPSGFDDPALQALLQKLASMSA